MFRVVLIFLLSLTACASRPSGLSEARAPSLPPATQPTEQPTPSQPIALAFEGVTGTLTVTNERGAVALLVSLSGLDPAQAYELSVGQPGALFDVHNAQLLAGSARGETIFVPDLTGMLRLRATHPERIAWDGRVIVYLASPVFKPLGRSEIITLAGRSH
jgi:hypothetical protein